MRIHLMLVPALVLLAGCTRGSDEGETVSTAGTVASSEELPPQLGFGQPATEAHIAAVGMGVLPDGRGLPAGSGTPEQGAEIYATRCASCHGAAGEGGAGGVLVGRLPNDAFNFAETREGERLKTIGSYWPQATSLFSYIKRAMPAENPGSLTDEEVYAVHRQYVTPADWDTPGREVTLDAVERWCFSCCTHYPHVLVEG